MRVGCTYCFFLLLMMHTLVAQRVHIIPEPVNIKEHLGDFYFNSSTKIYIDSKDKDIYRIITAFTDQFERTSGIKLQIVKQSISFSHEKNSVIVSLEQNSKISNKEGYLLNIDEDSINIIAPALPGLFYAFESLKQLLPPQFYNTKKVMATWNIPCADILDYPQYPYRGMHLDVSRHFFSTSFIKKYLDILASYKINTFHWHLTDSHGWRLEIKQYPKLTSVGAWRAPRNGIPMTIAKASGKNEPATYGGYYTQDEVKEIIQYAQDRFITIIPEIEMPGHCEAALVAYPQYNDLNNKSPLLIPCGYPGDLEHNFCAGYDSTYIFIENILKEVMQLFPSKYIHIGGDEVRRGPWLNCSRCQKKMKELGITTAIQLQAYFTQRIDSFIIANGKRLIGWDEILNAKLLPGSTVMSWHGNDGGIKASKKNLDVVMAPYHNTYFDFYQSSPNLEPDITYAQLLLDTVYSFNPMPPGLTDEEAKHILGGEACLWTENIATPARVEYMLLPRLLALSEVLWSPPENKNYTRFIGKVEEQFKRFNAAGINYAKSIYNVMILPVFDTTQKIITVALKDQTGKYPIHYTMDGAIPTSQSSLYTQPFVVKKKSDIKAADFDKSKRIGEINEDIFNVHKAIGSPISVKPGLDSEEIKSDKRLVDGINGTIEPYDGRWVSFDDSVVCITIDLGKITRVKGISFHCMEDQVSNIFLPKAIAVALSVDGRNYKNVYDVHNNKVPQQLLRHIVHYKKNDLDDKVKYVRIILKNADLFKNNPNNPLFFLDEIAVE